MEAGFAVLKTSRTTSKSAPWWPNTFISFTFPSEEGKEKQKLCIISACAFLLLLSYLIRATKIPQNFTFLDFNTSFPHLRTHKFNLRSFPSRPQRPQNYRTTTQLKFLHQSGKGGIVFFFFCEPVTNHQTGRSKEGEVKKQKKQTKNPLNSVPAAAEKPNKDKTLQSKFATNQGSFSEAQLQKKPKSFEI